MMALLLDHLWQSSIFVAGAALLAFALHANAANVRFWLWFAASMKFLVPFAALTALGVTLLPPLVAPAAAPTVMLIAPLAKPFSAPALAIGLPAAMPAGQAVSALQPTLAVAPAASHLNPAWALLAIWGLGFLALVSRWLVRWLRVHALLRDAIAMPLDAPVAVKFSDSLLEPGLVGILRPVILLPHGIEQQLSPAELKAVLAHELCHWRRHDNLLAALHMLVEAMFWFFPLVWWLGARLNAERERACDESVVAEGNDPELYAEGILKVCRAYLQSPLACVAGVSGAGLKQRIDAIMANQLSRQLTALRKLLLGAFVSASVIAPLVLGLVVAPLAHVPAQAKASLLARLNIHDEPAAIPAPSAETGATRAPDALANQPPPAAEQAPLPVPEAQLVTTRAIPEPVVGPVQIATINLPVMPGNVSSDDPKTAQVCHNPSVAGRAISSHAIELRGFNCFYGNNFGDNASTGPWLAPLHYGSCPTARTGVSDSKCKFDVTMNVQFANPSDTGKMLPGQIVTLAGAFRVSKENHVDYLSVTDAKITAVSFDPTAVPNDTLTCQPAELIEFSKQLGRTLCVQKTVLENLGLALSELQAAALSSIRNLSNPKRSEMTGNPGAITCRNPLRQTESRVAPSVSCARNSYWAAKRSFAGGDIGPFFQEGGGGAVLGPAPPGQAVGTP